MTRPMVRLRDGDGVVADTLRQVGEAPELSPEAVRRIHERVRSLSVSRAPVRPLRVAHATAGGTLGVAVLTAALIFWGRREPPGRTLVPTGEIASRVAFTEVATQAMDIDDPAPASPIALGPAPKVSPPRRAPPKAAPITRPLEEAATPAGPAESAAGFSLAEEAELLRKALKQTREDANPAAALRTLDEYVARFPSGLLRREALLARLEALIAAGDRDAALSLVRELKEGSVRAQELLVLEGELLASSGRCEEANEALDAAIAGSLARALLERALVARSSCRARLGDVAGSREDLEHYVREFPAGRYAAQARAALGR